MEAFATPCKSQVRPHWIRHKPDRVTPELAKGVKQDVVFRAGTQ